MEGLILSRKLGQSIAVDGPAQIRLVRISGGRVQYQVCAPSSTRITRVDNAPPADDREKPHDDKGGES